jgi:hypothetical protein
MVGPEMLIADYNVTNWMNIYYKGADIRQKCEPDLEESYRGLVRKKQQGQTQTVIIDAEIINDEK